MPDTPPLDDDPIDDVPTTPAQRRYIETLFRTRYSNFCAYALGMGAYTRADAEDAVQDAFERLLAGHHCLTAPEDSPAVVRYLYATIDGLIKNQWRDDTRDDRHRTHNTSAVQAVVGPSPFPPPDAYLQQCIAALPEQQRRVMLLARDGYTYVQIAKLLQIRVSTVNGHMSRALKRLRRELGDWRSTTTDTDPEDDT